MIHSQRGNKEALYIFEPNSFVPLATIQGAANNPQSQHTYWYQCDQIGAPQELTDAQGNIAWAADYKVWGEAKLRAIDWPMPWPLTGTDGGAIRGSGGGAWHTSALGSPSASSRSAPSPIDQPFRLQGQQFDEETGLHYNRFRYYDPVVGRFVSQDPIGLRGGFNLFAYPFNPNDWVDPRGLTGNPASATHVTYQGIKNGQPYIGYASMPGCHAPENVLKYRYGGNFSGFDGGLPPTPLYAGYGQSGKDMARGLEQKIFDARGGIDKTANKQNPVGRGNKRRDTYTAAAAAHCPCGQVKKPDC